MRNDHLFDLAEFQFAHKITCIASLNALKVAIGTDSGVMITKAKAGQIETSATSIYLVGANITCILKYGTSIVLSCIASQHKGQSGVYQII